MIHHLPNADAFQVDCLLLCTSLLRPHNVFAKLLRRLHLFLLLEVNTNLCCPFFVVSCDIGGDGRWAGWWNVRGWWK